MLEKLLESQLTDQKLTDVSCWYPSDFDSLSSESLPSPNKLCLFIQSEFA